MLTALKMEGKIRFGLGSTLAVSRAALAAAGGFEGLADSLADDYELGFRVAKAGFAVVLSREVVATSVPPYRLSEFLRTNCAGRARCGIRAMPATWA